MLDKKFIKQDLAVVLLLGAFLYPTAGFSEVVSLQGENPSSNDIIGAFMGNSGSEANDLPEGLMENVGDGSSEVKYRGISFGKKIKPEMASTKSMEPAKSMAPTETSNQQISGCPSNNAIAVNINFRLNSSEIEGSNQSLLNEISKAMNSPELSACEFIVEGHTDAVGDENYNLQLSRSRAMEVKNFLANADVRYSRMKVVGKGESELIITDNPNDSRNRRVQFRISN